ncbi:MAG: thioredoxin domain-containing protein [Anaerolineaceae bacterium]|nr:thioredoxin domain-containing protein [Anaerolineaceae bacterium]
MKNIFISTLIISALLLTACSEAVESPQANDPTATALVDSEESNPEPTKSNATAQDEGTFTNEEEPCKPFSLMTQTLAVPFSGLPTVTDDDWIVGPDDAAVTFLEYSDLQCPYCGQLEPALVGVQALYPEDVRLVFRHRPFPESFHDKSFLAAQAMEAAGKQGKFTEFKNYMFDRKTKYEQLPEHAALPDSAFWGAVPKDNFEDWLRDHIGELGLDATQFFKDMYSKEIVDKVQAAADSANSLGITGTPTLFINGYKWPENQRGIDIFSIYVQIIKSQQFEYSACPPTVIQPGKEYSATISTTKGDIEVDLFADAAPYAVNSFVFLAQEGWYDGLPFITTDEFALTGDPSDTGYGGPGYAYLDEISDEYTFDDAGKLATFGIGPGLNGSTFFINKIRLDNQPDRTIFGEVTKGMDVVNALEMRENIFEKPIDNILSITITEK